MLVRRDEYKRKSFTRVSVVNYSIDKCVRKEREHAKAARIHLAGNLFCPWTNQRLKSWTNMAFMMQALRVWLKEAAKSACVVNIV